MRSLSHRPINPAYYIEDCRIFRGRVTLNVCLLFHFYAALLASARALERAPFTSQWPFLPRITSLSKGWISPPKASLIKVYKDVRYAH